MNESGLIVRQARPEELAELGRLVAEAYVGLPGMPGEAEQPGYYASLRDAARRVQNHAINVFAAVGAAGGLVGSVDFIDDMKHYGSGGAASTVVGAAGVRLLAVKAAHRGGGAGKALTRFCIARAEALGRARLILHTTRAMATAWGMYERLGFERFVELDFKQGALEVFGFQLRLPLAGRAR